MKYLKAWPVRINESIYKCKIYVSITYLCIRLSLRNMEKSWSDPGLTNESMKQWIENSITQSLTHSINQSINQSIRESLTKTSLLYLLLCLHRTANYRLVAWTTRKHRKPHSFVPGCTETIDNSWRTNGNTPCVRQCLAPLWDARQSDNLAHAYHNSICQHSYLASYFLQVLWTCTRPS